MSSTVRSQILARGESEGFLLGTLSDVEILRLDGVRPHALAPLPTLAGLTPDELEVAVATAHEDDSEPDIASPDPSLDHDAVLAELMLMRREPIAVMQCEQQVADQDQFLCLYLFADDHCLTEEISTDGTHRFVAGASPVALHDIVAWCTPDLGEGNDFEPADIEVAEFERTAAEKLAEARRITVAVGTRPDRADQRRVTVYELPGACVAVMPLDGERLRILEVSRRTLTGVLASLVVA